MFKIKDGYKPDLKIPETIKLFVSTKKVNWSNKERRKCIESWSSWNNFSPMYFSR